MGFGWGDEDSETVIDFRSFWFFFFKVKNLTQRESGPPTTSNSGSLGTEKPVAFPYIPTQETREIKEYATIWMKLENTKSNEPAIKNTNIV